METEDTNLTPLPADQNLKLTPILDLSHNQDIDTHKHTAFDLLEKFISLNLPVYLVGPTGSGKTTAVEIIARKLGLKYYRKVVGPESSEGSIFGFNNATSYVEGIAFKPYTEGGILLIDEIDNGNPSTNIVVKMLSDGNECNFPHGKFKKHKDFRLVANANTFGLGSTRDYVGRSAQDAALLNIFAYIRWIYDEEFEYNICEAEYSRQNGKDRKIFNKFMLSVWKIRAAIKELAIRHIVSPRNSLYGSRLLASSVEEKIILQSVILRDLDIDTSEKILAKAKTIRHPLEGKYSDKAEIKKQEEVKSQLGEIENKMMKKIFEDTKGTNLDVPDLDELSDLLNKKDPKNPFENL